MIFFTFIVCQVNSWVPVLAAQNMRSEKINWIGDSSLLAYCQGLPLQLLRTGWRRRGDVVLNDGISFKMHCIYSAPFLFVASIIQRNSCAWNVICDRGDQRVFFLIVFHRRGGLYLLHTVSQGGCHSCCWQPYSCGEISPGNRVLHSTGPHHSRRLSQ